MIAAATSLPRATWQLLLPAFAAIASDGVIHRPGSTSAGKRYPRGGSTSTSYRLPLDEDPNSYHPMNHQQKRFASRVELALALALHKDQELRDHLVVKYGFEVHRIRPSTDRSTVHLLWDCHPNRVDSCRRFIQFSTAKIRHVLASTLGAKRVPYLEFVHDRLPPAKVQLQQTLDKVELMMQVESTMEPDPVAAAAIERLRSSMKSSNGPRAEEDIGELQQYNTLEVDQSDNMGVETRVQALQQAMADLAEFDEVDELDEFEPELMHDPLDSKHSPDRKC